MDQVFTKFGCPRELHSDQGANFESAIFQETCRLFGVRKTRTTSYHPRSDGMVERHNRTLQDMLLKCVNDRQDDWDQCLQLAAMAYRSTPHETTGETPNMLNFGREATLLVDLLVPPCPPDKESPEGQVPDAWDLQERLREAHEAARVHMSERMVSQKRQYDRNVRLIEYHPGNVVWLYRPVTKRGKSPKLFRHWTGPFLIQDRINQVNYRIQASPRSKAHVVHADRLKLCHGTRPEDLGFPGTTEPSMVATGGPPVTFTTPPPPEEELEEATDSESGSQGSGAEVAPAPVTRTRSGRAVRARRHPDFVYY